MPESQRIVFLGLSITSSWGNGHATNYRGLLRALRARGHDVLFLERDVPWYASSRDLPDPPFAETHLYSSLQELRDVHASAVRDADAVVVGSYVPDGAAVGEWALKTARGPALFYDIDTPVTLAALARGDCAYLTPELIPRYGAYLSFSGGPALEILRERYHARRAIAFYCLVDPEAYSPDPEVARVWDLGYLGAWAQDRQPALAHLLIDPAFRRPHAAFVVAGAQYPDDIPWPTNVRRIEHVPPGEHRRFYCSQRYTLNLTCAERRRLGWSPSVRLFEAAACGAPIISDRWPGIEQFLAPGEEIHLAGSTADVLRALDSDDEDARQRMARAARQRVLREHTAEHRAEQFEQILEPLLARAPARAQLAGAAP
jgi:spore maturation protein CgeB